ncbi:MAG: hypothetical protein ACPGVG_09755 [Mycobacterium sp.]
MNGIDLALRGFSIQFLCLRCGTFLSRTDEIDQTPIAAGEDLIAFQYQLLEAIPARTHKTISVRFTRFRHLIKTVGSQLSPREAMALGLSENEASSGAAWRQSRPGELPLGLPEVPRLVGAVLSKAWEETASSNVHYLQTLALREIRPREFRRAVAYEGFSDIDPSSCMPAYSRAVDEVDSTGEQIRRLVRRRGLRSTHVPEEVRYRSDPFLVDATVWCWRRYVCRQLRLWLLHIELSDEVMSSRHDGRPVPRAVDRRLAELKRSFYSRESIRSDFTAETAQTVLSQMLRLADGIAHQVTSRADPRVRLNASMLQRMAPSVKALGQNEVDLARAWMWLDEVTGHDAYGYLPLIAPTLMERFDRSLRPEERLSLREYRTQQQQVLPDDIAPHRGRTISALRLA